jgi:hypothetical protein
MDNGGEINKDIGSEKFLNQNIAQKSENLTCISNCEIINVTCSWYLNYLYQFLHEMGLSTGDLKCPVSYFKCEGNIATKDELTSGYYNTERLPYGSKYPKPVGASKCSHGGILDQSSYSIDALGGINKDSGFYLFSPRADLHLIAANLAIKHTEFYFNKIRARIGDNEFAKFLNIYTSDNIFNSINQYVTICSQTADDLSYLILLAYLFVFVTAVLLVYFGVGYFLFKNRLVNHVFKRWLARAEYGPLIQRNYKV